MQHTPSPIGVSAEHRPEAAAAVVFDHVSLAFDEHVVLRELSVSIAKGAMRMLLGASGAGKSIVLKLILGLLRPDSGTILVDGQRIDTMHERDLLRVRTISGWPDSSYPPEGLRPSDSPTGSLEAGSSCS